MGNRTRNLLALFWIVGLFSALYVYFFQTAYFESHIRAAVAVSPILAYGLFFTLGSLRGFTFIPSTYLIFLGLLFFSPIPLFCVLLASIVVSSVSVYYFSEFMRIDRLLEKKYGIRIAQVREVLTKNELPIIIAWSAFPLLPTDIICYVCGTLRVNLPKFIAGIVIGEGFLCAVYIFLGGKLIPFLQVLL